MLIGLERALFVASADRKDGAGFASSRWPRTGRRLDGETLEHALAAPQGELGGKAQLNPNCGFDRGRARRRLTLR
jgi:hypothetical protein